MASPLPSFAQFVHPPPFDVRLELHLSLSAVLATAMFPSLNGFDHSFRFRIVQYIATVLYVDLLSQNVTPHDFYYLACTFIC